MSAMPLPQAQDGDIYLELYLKGNNITTLSQDGFEGFDSLRTLVIQECNVSSIEPNAFRGLQFLSSLDLTRNNIKELHSFTFSGLSRLRRLILDSNNVLRVINNFAFNGLNLSRLSLGDNGLLTEIAPKAFDEARVHDLYIAQASISTNSTAAFRSQTLRNSLRTLTWTKNGQPLVLPQNIFQGYSFEHLTLDSNAITDVSFLALTNTDELSLKNNPTGPINFSAFPELKHARILRLGNTSFSKVQPQFFRDLTDLSQIGLQNNGITSVPVQLRPILSQLTSIDLENNILHCNCEMLWFKKWLLSCGSRVLVRGADCYTPTRDHVLYVNDREFVCSRPTLLDITQTRNVSERASMTMQCSGRGDPAPTITWQSPDGETVETPPSPNKSVLTNTGVLMISSTRLDDAGIYRCTMKNPAGNVTALVTVDIYSIDGSVNSRIDTLPIVLLVLCIVLFN
jgi:hypothetical protein